MKEYELRQQLSRDMVEAAAFDIETATVDAMLHRIAARVIEDGLSMAGAVTRIDSYYLRDNPEYDGEAVPVPDMGQRFTTTTEPRLILTDKSDEEWHTVEFCAKALVRE